MACCVCPRREKMCSPQWKVNMIGIFPGWAAEMAVLNYFRAHYIASFKLSGREEFRSGLGSSRAGLSSKLYDKLYDETEFKIRVKVPLKIRYKQENLVQYLNVHCDELLYDQILRAVNRPLEREGNEKIVNVDMRHLHYKKVKGGMRQLQDFQIQIKDNQGQLVKFEDGRKKHHDLELQAYKKQRAEPFYADSTLPSATQTEQAHPP